jgi:ATP-dependent DNA helicase RecG
MANKYPPFHPASGRFPTAMTVSELMAAFPRENDFVERKTGTGQRGLQRSITAFSNADGGVVLVGVDDAGSVVGRALTAATEDSIHQAALTLHDPGRYRIRELDVEGTPVTVVSVEKRAEGFTQMPDGQVLIRRGGRTVALIGAELPRFLSERALRRFELTDSNVPLTAADPDVLSKVRATYRWGERNLIERLREHGLVTGEGTPLLTIAGALALLSEPQEHLGKPYIEVLRYPDEGIDYDRRIEVTGPVQDQVIEATALVMDELGTDLIVSGVRRYDLPKIPEVVLREALANAVAHRQYEDYGRSVRVELRPDAVVVISPGGLPEPVTVENIREAQSARNLAVLKFLRRFNVAEDNGRGVDVMQDKMNEALLDPPRFEDQGHAVKVTLPIRGAISPQERAWVFEVERRGKLAAQDRITLVHAARGEALTNARVRELLGADSRDARASLGRLRDAGFLHQEGQRGGATYSLAPSVKAPVAFRLSPTDLEDFVTKLADDEPLTNARVRAATGLDRAETLRVLDKLVKDGRLRRIGERRGTRYVSPSYRNGQITLG